MIDPVELLLNPQILAMRTAGSINPCSVICPGGLHDKCRVVLPFTYGVTKPARLGILLAGLINVLNLDMYVIGGGVSSAWDAYAPNMFEELRERSLVYAATAPADPLQPGSANKEGASAQTESRSESKTIITRALLGSDAGLYGAARAAVMAG